MQKSKLPNSVLGRIWHLSDVDKDGQLDLYEFLLAKHLIQVKLDGFELPAKLPPHLKPPKDASAGVGGSGADGAARSVMAPPRWGSSVNVSRSVSRSGSVSGVNPLGSPAAQQGYVPSTGTLNRKRNVKGLDPSTMSRSMSATPTAEASATAANTQ